MVLQTGVLVSIEVKFARLTRYRRRLQTSSHRAPRYLVRYQLGQQAVTEIVVTGPLPHHLIAKMRASKPGDEIEVWLSDDRASLLDWNNLTVQRLLDAIGPTWGESD